MISSYGFYLELSTKSKFFIIRLSQIFLLGIFQYLFLELLPFFSNIIQDLHEYI